MSYSLRKRRAMAYLATLPNYRLKHSGKKVELEHRGLYGYDTSGGVYKTWKVIETVYFGL